MNVILDMRGKTLTGDGQGGIIEIDHEARRLWVECQQAISQIMVDNKEKVWEAMTGQECRPGAHPVIRYRTKYSTVPGGLIPITLVDGT